MEPTGKTSEEVEIPKLAENGQNWKIYCTKIIEAAAIDITDPLGVLAGWQPDDGSYDWECLDAILKWTFYTTVPITILHPIRKLDTVHEIFKYLVKRFRDPNPIVDPRTTSANDAKCDAHENSHMELRESPVSNDAAMERHADAKRDEEDLPNTKDLHNRGTEHIDEENIRRKDLHTSTEALVTGMSAECADGTLVLLKGTPHEMRNEPQNSLRATPRRLPIEGKPCECEQEAVNGVVMAGRTNGMVETAEPTIADVDRTALLGREPVRSAYGVDEGNRMEREPQTRLQEAEFYCKEDRQHSGNANNDVPNAHRLLPEGEWNVCVSGKARDPKGSTNVQIATPECVHHPSESRETEDVEGVESEGREGGMSERASVDEAIVKCCQQLCMADTPNELDVLTTRSMESESPNSSGIPCIHLGSTSVHARDVNGPGNQADESSSWADASSGQADESRGSMDTSDVSNGPETAGISHGESARTYLGAGDAKHVVDATDDIGSQTDTSSGYTDVPNVQRDVNKPTNAPDTVSIPRKKSKLPDSPIGPAKQAPDMPYGYRDRTDGLSMHRDMRSIEMSAEMAAEEAENIRTHQTDEETRNSPNTRNNVTSKHLVRWRKVSVGNSNVYVPRNAPVEALGTASRTIVFGQVETACEERVEAIAPGDVEGETVGNGNGEQNGNNGNVDGSTSSGSADSY